MERLKKQLTDAGICVKTEYPLSAHSSFRIGGAARLAVFPRTREELLLCLCAVRDAACPYLVIGNASNVVFSDAGFHGAILFTGAFREIVRAGNKLHVSAGASLTAVANMAQTEGLSGMEFAYGIPGTLGGAVFMNAGAYGGSMADICACSEYFDPADGKVHTLCGDAQGFGTRTSIYEKNPQYTVLGATLVLTPDDREAIAARMGELMARRKASQPLEYPSAGSVFKRPAGHFAGKLIEDCGLKGTAVGGAQVSQKHAGFIINRGGATAADVRALVELIQARVSREFGVDLECEIRFL